MNIQLTQPQWLELSHEVRGKLIKIFDIPRTEPTKTTQGLIPGKGVVTTVLSDGHSHKDLAHVTVERMQEFLGNYHLTDFFALFGEILNRIENEKDGGVVQDLGGTPALELDYVKVLTDIKTKAQEKGDTDELLKYVKDVFQIKAGGRPRKNV